jgi:hypothetical protein
LEASCRYSIVVFTSRTRAVFVATSLAFCAWSGGFVFRTSHVAVDGRRYYSLFDDAMISMRYAWNLSHGTGLVWNAGERIQGYTNLLMTLLMAVATLVFDRSAAVLSIQILGIVLMLGTAALAAATTAGFGAQSATRPLTAFFLVLGYYPLAYWSLLGMETGLLAFLLTAAVWGALRYARDGTTTHLFCSALCFGFAVLTRMDGVLFAIVTVAHLAWTAPPDRGRRWRDLVLFAGLIGAFVVGQTAFQYWYYGAPLPNTYTLKLTGMPLGIRVRNGLGFLAPFFRQSILILTLAAAGAWLTRRSHAMLLVAPLAVAIGYEAYVGGDPWDYWRIMAPCMPLAFVLVAAAIDAIIDRALPERKGWRMAPREVATTGCAIVVLLSASIRFLPEISLLYKPMQTANAAENIDAALVLREVTTPQATVAVVFAGTIPYYLDRRAIDVLGKSDRYIASLPPDLSGSISWAGMSSVPGHNKYDLDYSIKQLQPTYVQIMRWGRTDLTPWAASQYVRAQKGGVTMWLRKGSPDVRWTRVVQDHADQTRQQGTAVDLP